MPLVLDLSLSKNVTLPLYKTIGDVVSSNSEGGAFKRKVIEKAGRICFFIGDSSLPKDVSYGDQLLGRLDIVNGVKFDSPLYNVSYFVPPEAKSSKDSDSKEPPKEDEILLKEAVRDLEISWLKKIKSDDFKAKLYDRLYAANPTFIPLHRSQLESEFTKLKNLDAAISDERVTSARKVYSLADGLICLINTSELAMYYGVHHEAETPAEKELAQTRKQEKEALIFALLCKTYALKDLQSLSKELQLELKESESSKAFDESLKMASQWIGEKALSNGLYLLLWTWDQHQKKNFGTSLAQIHKYLKEAKKITEEDAALWKKIHAMKLECYTELKWDLWSKYEKRWSLVHFPADYAEF